MRAFFFAFFIGAAALFAQEVQDTVFLKDTAGTRRVGRVVGMDGANVKLQVTMGSAATASVSVPLSQIDRIEFAPNPAREKLLQDPAANPRGVVAEWQRWQGLLAVPGAPAPEIALAYGNLLLREKKADDALKVFERIETEGWSDSAKKEARQGRLRAMVAGGRAAEAVAEAREVAKESDDPAVLIEANFILAEAAFAQLKKLEEENPRWQEDIYVRPERARLYEEALDLYLHPYLFFGSDMDAAPRGLWGAIGVYRFNGDDHDAVESAKDLVMLYSGTTYATMAQSYLDEQPKDQPKNDKENDDEN